MSHSPKFKKRLFGLTKSIITKTDINDQAQIFITKNKKYNTPFIIGQPEEFETFPFD